MYTYKVFHFISNRCKFCKQISYKKMLFPIKWDGLYIYGIHIYMSITLPVVNITVVRIINSYY